MEGFLLKLSSQVSGEKLFAGLAALLMSDGRPAPVKCTKKLCTNFINQVDTVSGVSCSTSF